MRPWPIQENPGWRTEIEFAPVMMSGTAIAMPWVENVTMNGGT